MREVADGLWFWRAPHPDWVPADDPTKRPTGWPQLVTSYAVEVGRQLILIDPLAAPDELFERPSAKRASIILTCPWHTRDSAQLARRLKARVHRPRGPRERNPRPTSYAPGDKLPGRIVAKPALVAHDLVLWIPSHKALVFGDTFVDRELGAGLEMPVTWTPSRMRREERIRRLSPLLELGAELLLPTHGKPVKGRALARALA